MKTYLWRYWTEKIKKIENQTFDRDQTDDLFKEDVRSLGADAIKGKISLSEFDKLSTDLKIAYNIAYSKFRKHKVENSFWKQIRINLKSIHFGK